jgi:hypothetical protein
MGRDDADEMTGARLALVSLCLGDKISAIQ